MYWFKRMIEAAGLPSTRKSEDFNLERFYAVAEKAEVFVFAVGEKPRNLDEEMAHAEHSPDEVCSRCSEAAAPFSVVALEMAGSNSFIGVPQTTDKIPVYVACILINELPDGRYEEFLYTFAEAADLSKRPFILYISPRRNMAPMAVALLKRLDTERDGVEHVRERIKIGSGKSKRMHTIRRIIHICPTVPRPNAGPSGHRVIDWSYRFLRRGHWRHFWMDQEKTQLDQGKLGKNRQGDYCIPGKTWVSEAAVGPDDKPIVHKTRVVHADTK